MRMSGPRLRARAGAVLAAGALAACGAPEGGAATPPPATATRVSPHPAPRFDAEITLSDGRHVGVAYVAGRGLAERHRSATGEWSPPHLVYTTRTDRCGSVVLKAFGDTVTVIADWGDYCYDGEPPTESVAAVGTNDLTHWDTHLTADFDGWTKVHAAGDAQGLLFTRDSTESSTRLRWSRADGFARVEEIPR
ncbi:hypothetical protein [Streptomyces sp. NPDC048481]|uniref:hypothetical protein n=1 Tax=Streptomyces sp. NPDC048481 TaxID=3365557 RepID=UPI00372417C4